jgi:hypothetical protein
MSMTILSPDRLSASNTEPVQLDLTDSPYLSESNLLELLVASPELSVLNISGCSNITGGFVRTLPQKCLNITDLNVSKINARFSSKDAKALLSGGSLIRLDISENIQLGDEVFANNVAAVAAAVATSRLIWLSVAHCRDITGYSVVCLAEQHPFLRHLDLSGLNYITDAAVSVVVGCCKHLKDLWLDDCPSLTDQSVTTIVQGIPKIFSLHLSSSKCLRYDFIGEPIYCSQFTDDALKTLLDSARELQELTLRNQNSVSFTHPWFSTTLPRRIRNSALKKLDLSGVDSLNYNGMVLVFSHCTNLSDVLLSKRLHAAFRSKKFWKASFSKALYALSYEENQKLIKDNSIKMSPLKEVQIDKELVRSSTAPMKGSRSPVQDIGFGIFQEKLKHSPLSNSWDDSSPTPDTSKSWGVVKSPKKMAIQQCKLQKAGKKAVSINEADKMIRTTNLSSPKNNRSAREKVVDEQKERARALDIPYPILRPHPQAAIYRDRDTSYRLRLADNRSAEIIRTCWKVHVLWNRIRLKLPARKVALWYKKILDERRRQNEQRDYLFNSRASIIQRVYR